MLDGNPNLLGLKPQLTHLSGTYDHTMNGLWLNAGSKVCLHMLLKRRIITFSIIAAVCVMSVWAFRFFHTLRHVPEAFAAWDTGTLCVEYLRAHNDQWPTSWDELLTVLESDKGDQFALQGVGMKDIPYDQWLKEQIVVDWDFDIKDIDDASPISPKDGATFPVVWSGANPNEMIRNYLQQEHDSQDH